MYGDQIYMAWAVAGRIEVMHSQVNKGMALAAIADYVGADLSEVMAVGDGNNDLPMLRTAGVGVLMQNADEATLAAVEGEAIHRAPHIEEEGFAQVVKQFVLDV